jgi:ribosome-binding protein aMBF1 (putative translation factor)
LLDIKYGKIGSSTRDEYEVKANYFVISEMLKEARKEAHITQEQLADRIGTKKSYRVHRQNRRSLSGNLDGIYRQDGQPVCLYRQCTTH